jgi:hypothetical protein
MAYVGFYFTLCVLSTIVDEEYTMNIAAANTAVRQAKLLPNPQLKLREQFHEVMRFGEHCTNQRKRFGKPRLLILTHCPKALLMTGTPPEAAETPQEKQSLRKRFSPLSKLSLPYPFRILIRANS